MAGLGYTRKGSGDAPRYHLTVMPQFGSGRSEHEIRLEEKDLRGDQVLPKLRDLMARGLRWRVVDINYPPEINPRVQAEYGIPSSIALHPDIHGDLSKYEVEISPGRFEIRPSEGKAARNGELPLSSRRLLGR